MKLMKKMTAVMAVALLLLITLFGCSGGKSGDAVYIALAGPTSDLQSLGFQRGMDLALGEINEKGILGGKHIVIDQFDEQEDLTKGIRVAQEIVSAQKYTAVIGHFTSSICIATKNTYNDGKILVMSPLVSNVNLTEPPLPCIFRNIASDAVEIDRILAYAQEQGYKKLAVVYQDNEYGQGLSSLINQKCLDYDIDVVDYHRDFVNAAEFERQYDKWTALGVDAVFIGDSMPAAGSFISDIRSKSRDLPILGPSGFNFADIAEELGTAYATNIVYMDPYYADTETENYKVFCNAYKKAYGTEPEYLSLIAYDTVNLLAAAIDKAGTTDALEISKVLKETGHWSSVLGEFSFDEAGSAVGSSLTLVNVQDGVYSYQ